jgi:hypothetical protein
MGAQEHLKVGSTRYVPFEDITFRAFNLVVWFDQVLNTPLIVFIPEHIS